MDALALLCNLYGDGPATLARLRAADCASFERLGALAPEDLAEILSMPLDSARRFLREARLLLERLSEGVLDPDDAQGDGAAHAGDPLLERVLHAWRDKDLHDAPAAEPEPQPERAQPRCEPLRPDLLDGLDGEWCARLHQFGVDSLEELAEAESLELARAMEVALTRLMRLQFLARRRLESLRLEDASVRDAVLWPRSARGVERSASPAQAAAPEPPPERAQRFSPAEAALRVPPRPLEADLRSWSQRHDAPSAFAAQLAPVEGVGGPFAWGG